MTYARNDGPMLEEEHIAHRDHFEQIEKQLQRTREYLVAAQAAAWEAFRECGRLRYGGNFVAYQLNYGADVVEGNGWNGGFVESHGGALENFEVLLGVVEGARAQASKEAVLEREEWFKTVDLRNAEKEEVSDVG